jgi:RNA polymerase sigma-70 factor (ECF subfamily)
LEPLNDLDVKLMIRVQAGDRGAFRQLFERYFPSVVRYIAMMVRDPIRAEELAQEVFLNLYRVRTSYEPRTRFRTFLFRIATNAAISEQRARARERRALQDLSEHRAIAQPSLSAGNDGAGVRQNSAEEALMQSETLSTLYRALDELPERQKAALLLARMEGMSYRQVAKALGVSVPAVKSLVHRATLWIRKRCKEDQP